MEKIKLDSEDLVLLKIQYDMSTDYAIESFYNTMTKKEQKKIDLIINEIPNVSNQNKKEMYWDVILVDSELKSFLEDILTKYKIKYKLTDLTQDFYNKKIDLDSDFVEELEQYINKLLTVDKVLDRISKVGISNINLFELSYLDRISEEE